MSAAIDESTIRDAELHNAWQNGDRRAAVKLVRDYGGRLRRFGERRGLTAAEAEELAQEVLMAAQAARFEARVGASYWSWLVKIAQHKVGPVIDRRRMGASMPRRLTTPWTALSRSRLLEAIESMAVTDREVFVRLAEGLALREIAVAVDLTPAAVAMRICRGRQWLRARGV